MIPSCESSLPGLFYLFERKKGIDMIKNDIHWIKTHCARMDHGGCALLVGVKENKIVAVKGDPDGFLNRGYVCIKGIASPDRLTHPDRLKHPLKRVGKRGEGKWQKISWNDALTELAEGFNSIRERYGAKGVAFCFGMPKGLEHFLLIRLANAFGSPNIVGIQDVCHAPREITGIHTCGFYPVTNFHCKSDLVVLWGSNVTATNEEGEIGNRLLDQVKEGTQLIVIDPRKTDMAERAALWLQPRPGTDCALALGFLHVMIEESLYDQDFVEGWTYGFDELRAYVQTFTPEMVSKQTWVPAELIRRAARLYARSKPAAIQWGNPIEHQPNTFDTARAIISLMALSGNLDIPGGNIQAVEPDILGLGKFVRADLLPNKRKEMISAAHHVVPRFMTIPSTYFRKAVLEGVPYPVRGAYVTCSNPMLAYADSNYTYEALTSLDFLAVTDVFMTPTAALADIVLPAATQFECDDIGHYGLGHGYILARRKIVDPPEDCWPDLKILNELGKRISPEEYWYDDHNRFLDDVLRPSGLSFEEFLETGYLKGADKFKKYEQKGFKTPTGKVELKLSTAEKLGLNPFPIPGNQPDPEGTAFPLLLTSSKSHVYLHSSYRWVQKLRARRPAPKVEIHPDTARERNIEEGSEVIIETKHGKIEQIAHITDAIHPRVINASHGWWYPEGTPEKQYEWERSNYNMLTAVDSLGREYGTPRLRGIGCNIEKK